MTPITRSAWFIDCITPLVEGQHLTESQARAAFDALTRGEFHSAEAAAFLIALRQKGETAQELATAVSVLREKALSITSQNPHVIDTCGTGGDHSGTFNISTAVAFVLAGCGLCVVKHGNRSVSSLSGSSDVLQSLGVPIESGVEWAQRSLDRLGIAFCYAPHFHPALAHVGPIRRQLGVRTTFNLLGPLLNPARAGYQLIGVGPKIPMQELAKAAQILGTTRTAFVRGHDGLDEVTLETETYVLLVTPEKIEEITVHPNDFALPVSPKSEVLAANPQVSAKMILDIFNGEQTPALNYVLANAALALHLIDPQISLREGVARSREAIANGNVQRVYQALVAEAEMKG